MPQVAALSFAWHSWVVLRSTPGGDIYSTMWSIRSSATTSGYIAIDCGYSLCESGSKANLIFGNAIALLVWLILQHLVSDDDPRSGYSTAEEGDEDAGHLVSVLYAERQHLHRQKHGALDH